MHSGGAILVTRIDGGSVLVSSLFSMTEVLKRMRTSSGGSMSTAPSNAMVKREETVEQRAVVQGSEAARDDSDKYILVRVERDRWLHCTACSAPFKLPVYKCDAAGHKVCVTCRGDDKPGASNRCRACNGAAASFTRCSGDFQDIIRAPRVACPYKAYGCRMYISYVVEDEHRSACPEKPCSCSEPADGCDGGFLGSPRTLHDHLAGPLHSWPTSKIEYSKTHTLGLTEPRRLLFSEGEGRVFVLAVSEDATARLTNVSLMCLRSSAAAAAWPHYKFRLWSHAPTDPVTGVVERHEVEAVLHSRASPCEITVREGMLLPLQPQFLHGAARKIILYLRIDKLKPISQQ